MTIIPSQNKAICTKIILKFLLFLYVKFTYFLLILNYFYSKNPILSQNYLILSFLYTNINKYTPNAHQVFMQVYKLSLFAYFNQKFCSELLRDQKISAIIGL